MALLDHVGVRVTDLDRAVRFYTDMFGFEMIDRRMLGGGDVEAAAMKVSDDALIFLLYNASFAAHEPSIEHRPDHFCLTFEQDEFDGVMSRMEAAGVFDRLDCALQPRTGATGRSPSKYIFDPDNNQIEVKARTPAGAQQGSSQAVGAAAR